MKRYRIIVAFLLVGIGLLWFAIRNSREQESTYRYQGKSAREWILHGKFDYGFTPDVIVAISAMGSNAVPDAVTILRTAHLSITDKMFLACVKRLPSSWRKQALEIHPMPDIYSWQERAEAALGIIGPNARAAIPYLVRSLGDQDTPWTSKALAKIGHEAVPPLLERIKLRTGKEQERASVIFALGIMQSQAVAAVPILADELYDGREQQAAEFALSGIGSAAVPTLMIMLTNSMAKEREKAVKALTAARPNYERVLPVLISAMHDTEPTVRRQAAASLGQMAIYEPSAVPPLITGLKDLDVTVQLEAIKSLGHAGTNGVPSVTQLIWLLSETNVIVQEQLCLALGRIGPLAKEAVSAVSPLVQSGDVSVRLAASVALAALKQTP